MITLFTGMPGAGKTAALVDLLSKLPGDRPIYVHYDPAAKRRPDQVVLHESLKIPHEAIHVDQWPGELPDDAIMVIDEVQDVWRPRGSTSKVPDAVAALETHRHSGIDFYLTTQAPRLVDANVRGLVGRHVHIRDTGWLGRHWYEWPECNDGLTWKSCPVKKKFKLPAKVFELYQSATSHHAQIRATPPALYWAIGAVVLAVVAGLFAVRSVTKTPDVKPVQTPVVTPVQIPNVQDQRLEVSGGNRLIDDRVDFIPRVSSKPESAPAYDHLRVVSVMPVVVGGVCMGSKCKCYTAQGTDVHLSDRECKDFIDNRPFNPYDQPDRRDRMSTPARTPGVAPAVPSLPASKSVVASTSATGHSFDLSF